MDEWNYDTVILQYSTHDKKIIYDITYDIKNVSFKIITSPVCHFSPIFFFTPYYSHAAVINALYGLVWYCLAKICKVTPEKNEKILH